MHNWVAYSEDVKLGAAFVSGLAAYLWGPWDALTAALIVMVSVDYITGLIKAAIKKELSSEIGWKGLLKKVCTFLLVAVATVADNVINSTHGALRAAVIMYYIANEALSIAENAGEMGVPIPPKLRSALRQLKSHGEEPEENKESEKSQEGNS
ncbi:MAG: phage holin family protein [Clostridia bacterium]